MPPRGDGKWIEAAGRLGADLPPDRKGRRAAILERCKAEELNERIVSRMISARDYAIRYVDERSVRASHRTVEAMMALERADGQKAAAIREDVLRGNLSRAVVDERLHDAAAAQEAVKGEATSMSLTEIIDFCCADLGDRGRFDWTQIPNAGVGWILGADAEYTYPEVEFDDEGKPRSVEYIHVWALTVSPHIRCSTIYDKGEREFLRSIASLSCQYNLISIFCSSNREAVEMKTRIAQCLTLCVHELNPGGKFIFHVFGKP